MCNNKLDKYHVSDEVKGLIWEVIFLSLISAFLIYDIIYSFI